MVQQYKVTPVYMYEEMTAIHSSKLVSYRQIILFVAIQKLRNASKGLGGSKV